MGRTVVRARDDMPRGEVAALCARLGVTADVLGSSRRFLLVTASARPGARPVAALFAAEDDARAAFVRFRQAEPCEGPWAELAELGANGGVRRLCWFGTSMGPTDRRESYGVPDHPPTDRSRWRLIRRLLLLQDTPSA